MTAYRAPDGSGSPGWLPTIIAAVMAMGFYGCAALGQFHPDVLNEYESQKRIVRQGFARVPVPEGEWEAIFFGYDRNRDYRARPPRDTGRGIDLLEYKRLLPGGHWEFRPFLVLVDENFDGYVDWVCLDYDRDARLDAVYAPSAAPIHFDRIDFRHFRPFENLPVAE
jgi:hypothetical protein